MTLRRRSTYVLRYEAPLLDAAIPVGWIYFIKAVLYLQGHFKTPNMRLPYHSATKDEIDVARTLLQTVK